MPLRNVVVVLVLAEYCIVARTHWPRIDVDGAFAASPYHDPLPTAVVNLSWYMPKYSRKSDAPLST